MFTPLGYSRQLVVRDFDVSVNRRREHFQRALDASLVWRLTSWHFTKICYWP